MVLSEQQVEGDRTSSVHNGTGGGILTGFSLSLFFVVPREDACSPCLCLLSSPPPVSPALPTGSPGQRYVAQVATHEFQLCSKPAALFSQVSQMSFPPPFDLYAAHASHGYK